MKLNVTHSIINMAENEDQPQQLINGILKPLSGIEATSNIPVIKSKAEYLRAVMYEGVRFSKHHSRLDALHLSAPLRSAICSFLLDRTDLLTHSR